MKPSVEKKPEKVRSRGIFISLLLLLLFWIIISLPSNVLTRQGIVYLLQHLAVGIPLAFLVTCLTGQPILSHSEITAHRLPCILRLLVYFFYLIGQILIAGVDVACRVLRPKLNISPGVIKFHTPLHDDLQITINANSITLTPGTITLDVETDDNGSTFWVHCISKKGQENMKTRKGFVDKILNIYRKKDVN
jgi:multicomponent Na+:H+ antiporter subunit E